MTDIDFSWKISEKRRAVKETIRQAICYAEGRPVLALACTVSSIAN